MGRDVGIGLIVVASVLSVASTVVISHQRPSSVSTTVETVRMPSLLPTPAPAIVEDESKPELVTYETAPKPVKVPKTRISIVVSSAKRPPEPASTTPKNLVVNTYDSGQGGGSNDPNRQGGPGGARGGGPGGFRGRQGSANNGGGNGGGNQGGDNGQNGGPPDGGFGGPPGGGPGGGPGGPGGFDGGGPGGGGPGGGGPGGGGPGGGFGGGGGGPELSLDSLGAGG